VTIKPAKPNRLYQREGLSLVELLMAMTLLALISMAGLKIMQPSESSFSEGRTQLTIQQKNQAITAFINDDFKNRRLAEQTTAATYENMAMPADLRGDQILNLATIFGNGSRFAFAAPKCVLVDQAQLALGYFTFAADCHMVGGKTIAALINIPLDAGAKIAFAKIDSNCSHYVEWGGQSTGPEVTLAHRSQIDVVKHRKYCQLE
jgi:prepilin-type N-terminal cleavage/methylation domain-containing protein